MIPALGLVPRDPAFTTIRVDWVDELRDFGLIAEPFDFHGSAHHVLGDRFFNLVSFLGCMPYLVLDPEEGLGDKAAGFCHASLIGPLRGPRFMVGPGTRQLRCGSCREPLIYQESRLTADGLVCAHCSAVNAWDRLRFGDTGAIASTAILIHGVHRAEAVPSNDLLSRLEQLSDGSPWRYFYLS